MKKKDILQIYNKMSLIRLYDEKIIEEYPKKEIRCPVHLSIGQEGICGGIFPALKSYDIVMSNHRAHGHYLAKNCDINSMTSEIYGKKNGCSGGKGGSMHLIDIKKNFFGSTPIVASTIPILTGIAFANKIKKKNNLISVIFFGDGAYESGNFHECLNFASVHNLRILFVCENNYFSVYSSLDVRQPKNLDISKVAESHKIKSCKLNGNKADNLYLFTKNVRKYIINKSKPFFIELNTYRYLEHCGINSDDHLAYRKLSITEYWKKNCPIIYFESKYKKYKVNFNIIKEANMKIINKAFNFAKRSSFPKKKDLFKNLYA
jgi:pyruvate dehydrogenase E1 component alpha subunit